MNREELAPQRRSPRVSPLRTPVREWPDVFQSSALITIVLTLLGGAFFLGLFVLHIRFDQAPHRLFKIIGAAAALVLFVSRPRWALVGSVLAMPYVEWLPKSGLPFLNSLNLLLGALLVSAMTTSWKKKVPILAPSRLRGPILLFIFWMFLSWLHAWVFPLSTYPAGERLKDIHQSIVGLYFFLLAHRLLASMKPSDATKWIRGLAVLMVIAPALGALGAIWQSSGLRYGERVGGGIGDINKMAAFFAMALVWSLAAFPLFGKKALSKLLLVGLVLLNTVGLVLPNSRGGFVAFLVAGAGMALSKGFRGLAIGLVFLATVPFWIPEYVEQRINETLGVIHAEDRFEAMNDEAGGRFNFWGAALNVIIRHPVMGVGWGVMPEATEAEIDVYKSTHNFYLELTGEMGIGALILLLVILYRILRRANGLSRAGPVPDWVRAVGVGVLWSTVALMAANVFGSRFFHFSLSGYLFLGAALVERSLQPDLWRLRTSRARTMRGRGASPRWKVIRGGATNARPGRGEPGKPSGEDE